MKLRRTPLLLLLTVFVCCESQGDSRQLSLEQVLAADWSALEYQIVTTMSEDERGGLAVVLLHGYGSESANHAPLANAILAADTRVFIPTAVLPHSSGRGAIWWEFLDDDWPKPLGDSESASANGWPEPSKQLPKAREAVMTLINKIRRQYQPDRMAIVGHSQGAMLALDVGMLVEPPVQHIAALSGYVLLDSVPNIEKPRTDRPTVFISHGRQDDVVEFAAAERMNALLKRNGFSVAFAPHDEDHGISVATGRALREFLQP